MTPRVTVIRNKDTGRATYGNVIVTNQFGDISFFCKSLELPFRNNRRNISCIPTGVYPLVFEYSPAFKRNLWEIKDVPGRSECKFHAANNWEELAGCVALGFRLTNIDADEDLEIIKSSDAITCFHEALKTYESQPLKLQVINTWS